MSGVLYLDGLLHSRLRRVLEHRRHYSGQMGVYTYARYRGDRASRASAGTCGYTWLKGHLAPNTNESMRGCLRG